MHAAARTSDDIGRRNDTKRQDAKGLSRETPLYRLSLPRILAVGVLLVIVTPSMARADGFIVPFVGVNFGGDAGQSLGDGVDAKRIDWGASFGWMSGGVFGVEGDIGYSPDFYGKSDLGGSGVVSLMGNILLGIPFGGQHGFGIRPYGLVGFGALRSNLDSFSGLVGLDNTKVSWDFGGGVMIFFAQHVGIRGDVRYFRTFNGVDLGPFQLSGSSNNIDYTRGSIGFVLRF
jgi:opacity protein-like surface antigen